MIIRDDDYKVLKIVDDSLEAIDVDTIRFMERMIGKRMLRLGYDLGRAYCESENIVADGLTMFAEWVVGHDGEIPLNARQAKKVESGFKLIRQIATLRRACFRSLKNWRNGAARLIWEAKKERERRQRYGLPATDDATPEKILISRIDTVDYAKYQSWLGQSMDDFRNYVQMELTSAHLVILDNLGDGASLRKVSRKCGLHVEVIRRRRGELRKAYKSIYGSKAIPGCDAIFRSDVVTVNRIDK